MRVVSVNTSLAKGTPKTPVEKVELCEGFGIMGDAHAAPGDRQVSLLAKESYERFEKRSAQCLKKGAFGENIVTEGIVLHKLNLGQRMQIGKTVLEVSKIGKECHAPCAIAASTGDCIMPKEGIFARVLQGGTIRIEDPIVLKQS